MTVRQRGERSGAPTAATALSDQEFAFLRDYLRAACGIEISQDKRYLFETRLVGFTNGSSGGFAALCAELVAGNATLRRRLVEAMTTNETSFFRDGHPFATLRHQILPELAARRSAEALALRPRLRVLCVGCATGEEPYSVAACLHAWVAGQQRFEPRDTGVLAVDVSSEALAKARQGLYEAKVYETLPAEYRPFFARHGDKMTPLPALRSSVVFGEVNLVEPLGPLGCFDVILCRNVIIYFALQLRRRIVEQLFELLRPGGALLLGASESLYGVSDAFQLVHGGATTYYRREDAP